MPGRVSLSAVERRKGGEPVWFTPGIVVHLTPTVTSRVGGHPGMSSARDNGLRAKQRDHDEDVNSPEDASGRFARIGRWTIEATRAAKQGVILRVS